MPAILGALGALIIQLLRQYMPGIVGRVLLAFGITLAASTIALPALENFIQSKVNGGPAVMVAYFYALGIDVAVTMILSTIAAVRAQRVFLSKISQ